MELTATLICIFLFLPLLASDRLLPDDDQTSRKSKKLNPEKEEDKRIGDQQQRSGGGSKSMKVIDVSADNDQKADSNGEFTSATLYGGALPQSFTICSAFMVDAWTTEQSAADLFSLRDDEDQNWANINMVAASSSTTYTLNVGQLFAVKEIETVFFPLQWTHACLSQDSKASMVSFVVDGQLLVEEEYKMEEDEYRPANLSLLVGLYSNKFTVVRVEYTGRVANLNVFASSSSVERMVGLTTAGADECGAPGDLLSWEESEWTLHSQAKMVELDRDWEGPCRREPKVHIFIADFEWRQKIVGFMVSFVFFVILVFLVFFVSGLGLEPRWLLNRLLLKYIHCT